jgi:hypothetical protein
MIVATLIMSVAIVGLLSALSGATRNAAHLRDYDRMAQLARLRMNDLLADPALPRAGALSGSFDRALTGGADAGWQVVLSPFEGPARAVAGSLVLDRIQLQIWWMSGQARRSFTLEGFRQRTLTPADLGGSS